MKLAARNERRSNASWIARRLVQLRAQAGLTQAEVARRMGRLQPVVYRLERATHLQRLDLVAAFCTAVGADLEAVFSVDHEVVDG